MKKFFVAILFFLIMVSPAKAEFIDLGNFSWAKPAIEELSRLGIVGGTGGGGFSPGVNVTRAEYITIIIRAAKFETTVTENFKDVKSSDYYYQSVGIAKKLGIVTGKDDNRFYPNEPITRQDMLVILARTLSETTSQELTYKDKDKISSYALPYVKMTASYIHGDEKGNLNPQSKANRAEAATILYRAFVEGEGSAPAPSATVSPSPSPVPSVPISGTTPILGKSKASIEQMEAWAKSCNAASRFVDIAEVYWKYGELTGIRADVLYAQAAKETNFGKYGGRVTANMNNWAGIKIKTPSGDNREDHETFETPDDGVRAHFNHMAAYVGKSPIGKPHDRYYIALSTMWAGTVKYVEELSGKWAPAGDYGSSIVSNYLNQMIKTKEPTPIDKSKKVVYISPSNQFYNIYSAGDTTEGEQMISLGTYLRDELVKRGFTVVMAEVNDEFETRASAAADAGAFAYVSLHSNAANSKAVGTECFFKADDVESWTLANAVYQKVANLTPTGDRGLKDGTASMLKEMRLAEVPSCLIEIEFHDTVDTAKWIIANKGALAKAIADGIEEYWRK